MRFWDYVPFKVELVASVVSSVGYSVVSLQESSVSSDSVVWAPSVVVGIVSSSDEVSLHSSH